MHLNSHIFFSLLVNQIRSSQKLKGIMKRILYLGNTLNQGTVRGKHYDIINIFLLKTLLSYVQRELDFKSGADKTLDLLSAGAAVGFKLESLLTLSDTRAANSKMTLMHYLCKVKYNLKKSILSQRLQLHLNMRAIQMMSQLQLRSRKLIKHKHKLLKLIQDFQNPYGSPVDVTPYKQRPGERKRRVSRLCIPPS